MLEFNIDGLIGPTHHFGGLGIGNIASESNQSRVSYPRRAALEGLSKMRLLYEMGIPQFFLPPPRRPHSDWFKKVGFDFNTPEDRVCCFEFFPAVFSSAFSSSFMWMANAASVSVGVDCLDGMNRFIVANLAASLHREQECNERYEQLSDMFSHTRSTEVVRGLPAVTPLRDEGAANVMRLWNTQNDQGIYVFVYGEAERDTIGANDSASPSPRSSIHPSRQSRLASRLVSHSLRIRDSKSLFVQQHPKAIDAGVFHNDVIATSHENFLLVHSLAFQNQSFELERIRASFHQQCGTSLRVLEIEESELTLEEAVRTYLFNSQIVTRPNGDWLMLCPVECQHSESVQKVLRRIQKVESRIRDIEFVSLRESMANGGGPACLRLRAYLTEREITELPPRFRIDDQSLAFLERFISTEYPESVRLGDFLDSELQRHCEWVSDSICNYRKS